MNMREPCIYLVYADPNNHESPLVEDAGYVRLLSGHPEWGSHFKALVENAITGELSSEDIDTVTMLAALHPPLPPQLNGLAARQQDIRWTDAIKAARHRQDLLKQLKREESDGE